MRDSKEENHQRAKLEISDGDECCVHMRVFDRFDAVHGSPCSFVASIVYVSM